jgi:hypothetical protein
VLKHVNFKEPQSITARCFLVGTAISEYNSAEKQARDLGKSVKNNTFVF